MAGNTELDERESMKPDLGPGSKNTTYNPDGSHDKGAISPEEQTKFKEMEKGEQDIAAKEAATSKQGGQTTSTNTKEQDLANTDDDQVGKGYPWAKRKVRKKKRRRLVLMVGMLGIAISIFGTVAFLPTLLMKQMMSRLNGAFMDRVDYALQVRTEKYVSKYLGRITTNPCGFIVDSSCSTNASGGFTSRVYGSWKDGKIENKLFREHGIEVRTDSRTGRSTLLQNGVEVGETGKRSLKKEVNGLIDRKTRRKGVVKRRHLRSFLSRKHGATKWCIIACKKRDDFSNKTRLPLARLKIRLTSRILTPVSAKASAYMLCFISTCTNTETLREGSKATKNALERVGRETLEEAADKIAGRTTGQFVTQSITANIVEKLFKKSATEAADLAAKGVPYVGQVWAAITAIDILDQLDKNISNGAITRYAKELREDAYLQYAESFLILADDVQSSDSDLDDKGANPQLLYGFNASRLYQSINNVPTKSTVECEKRVLSGNDDPLICPELSVNPGTHKLETAWAAIKKSNPQIDNTLKAYNTCYLGVGSFCTPKIGRIDQAAHGAITRIDWVIGKVAGPLFSLLKSTINTLPLGPVLGWIGDGVGWAFGYVSELLFPVIIDTAAEGAQAVNQIAGGLDVIANKFLEGSEDENGENSLGLGAPVITAPQQAELQLAINDKRVEELSNQSVFARYMDLNNPNSLLASSVIRFGSIMPMRGGSLKVGVQPLSFLGNLSSLFGLNKTTSAFTEIKDRTEIFGVTQYGFPVDDIAMTIDPDDLTPEACREFAEARKIEGTGYMIDPDTGEKLYLVSNPCILDEVVVDSLTKAFDLDAESEFNAAETYENYDYPEITNTAEDTSGIPCAGSWADESVVSVGDTNVKLCKGNRGVVAVNASWSKAVDDMLSAAETDGVSLAASGFRTAEKQIQLRRDHCADVWTTPPGDCNPATALPGTSNHELGLALDVSSILNQCGSTAATCAGFEPYDWLVKNAGKFGMKKLSSEAWHWSVNGR